MKPENKHIKSHQLRIF